MSGRVHERGHGHVLGLVAVRRHQLQHREREDARGRRPVPQPLAGTPAAPGSAPRAAVCATHATARPIARHGLNARNTSPNSTDSRTRPSQKITNTNVGAKLAVAVCTPASPLHTHDAEQADADGPAQHLERSAGEQRRDSPRGSGRNPPSCSRGWGHRTASATNETTSTIAARPAEQPLGDRKVRPPDDPVRDLEHQRGRDHEGSTTSRAISGSRPASSAVWLSISKTPSVFALKRKRAGLPGRRVARDVVAVQVDLVAGVGGHDQPHRVPLLRPRSARTPPTGLPPRSTISSGGGRGRRLGAVAVGPVDCVGLGLRRRGRRDRRPSRPPSPVLDHHERHHRHATASAISPSLALPDMRASFRAASARRGAPRTAVRQRSERRGAAGEVRRQDVWPPAGGRGPGASVRARPGAPRALRAAAAGRRGHHRAGAHERQSHQRADAPPPRGAPPSRPTRKRSRGPWTPTARSPSSSSWADEDGRRSRRWPSARRARTRARPARRGPSGGRASPAPRAARTAAATSSAAPRPASGRYAVAGRLGGAPWPPTR